MTTPHMDPGITDTVTAAESTRATKARSTRQKRALNAVLDASDSFRSAQDLHAELRARGEDGETRYRRCTTEDHHHHLVCRHCGHTVEIEGPEVERWATTTAERHGFTRTTHTVEILGLCADCSLP